MKKKNFFSKSISTKLITLFLAVSVIPIIMIGLRTNNSARKALEASALNQLESVGTLRKQIITDYLDRKITDMEILSHSQNTVDAFEVLHKYHHSQNTPDQGLFNTSTGEYSRLYEEIDPYFREYATTFNLYDIFLICADHGHVMYSVAQEDDLGISLSNNKFKESSLRKVWENALLQKKAVMEDYSIYSFSGEPALFIGNPVFNEENEIIAVLVIQLSTDHINEVMHDETGLGQSGETYLVGKDNLMRSDSRFESESVILTKKIETESVKLGLEDKSGTHIINDYRGTPVLSYYSDIGLNENIGTDFDWVIIAEINKAEALESVTKLKKEISIFVLILSFIVGFIAYLFSRYFTKPIIKLTEISSRFAKGDLSQEIDIDQHDEIGKLANSFKQMQGNLRKQIEDISEGINILSSSSTEIMSTVSQLASSAAETASSVSETTSTIEEVKQTAEIANQNATEVAESTQKLSLVSQDGTRSIQKTIDGMGKIKEQMESIADIVIQLSDKSHTIGEIANSVNDLAEQSNLLAVNASIEAAKAGEHGKGFTVVAQEIKNLAERSKESTIQIQSILSAIQKSISSAVLATENGSKVIDDGFKLSANSSEVITTMAASIEQASQANIQIAASSQQQLIGMDQITSAMENINEASMQTANSTKQSEESVIDLNKLGEKLQGMLKLYKLK